MSYAHEYLSTLPFDFYDLTLFEFVAQTGSFTRAGTMAGLTQSAITRRIAAMESKLDLRLFERTTRRVVLTSAGLDLRARIGPLINQTHCIAADFVRQHGLRPPELHIGVARSIGLAYLPGYFFAFQKEFPDVLLNISQHNSREILQSLEAGNLDAGLICPPKSLPRGLQVTHRFTDEFTLVVPPHMDIPVTPVSINEAQKLLAKERWLLLDQQGNTGAALRRWLEKQSWKIEPAMELDSFDLITNLVSLGLGVSFVPHRVLPLYEKRRAVKRVRLKQRFQRELVVVVRQERNRSPHLAGFIRNVLF